MLKHEIVTITPAIATKWLEQNKFDNRNLSEKATAKIARDIKKDKWVFDGNPIRFDSANNVLDGQHRLWACVMADKPIKSLVVRGLDVNAKDTIDTGKSRNNADIFHFNGHTSGTVGPALCRMAIGARKCKNDMWVWANGAASTRLSSQELLAEIDSNPRIQATLSAIDKYRMVKKIIGPGTAAFAYYLLSHGKKGDFVLHGFFECLDSGANLTEDNPILVLRNALTVKQNLIDHKLHGGNKAVAYKMALVIKAWNAYHSNTKIKRLRFDPKNESYPQVK